MLCCRVAGLLSLLVVASIAAHAAKPEPCVSTDAAAKMLNKDIGISAHIYDVVQLEDGTRFLDVCSTETSDNECRFTVVSFALDRSTVGELTRYRDMNVQIRGTVQPISGRAGIFLSHARQFSGGPPKFRPNPLLARGFNAEENGPPVNDPNLRIQGGRRAFMNSRVEETIQPK